MDEIIAALKDAAGKNEPKAKPAKKAKPKDPLFKKHGKAKGNLVELWELMKDHVPEDYEFPSDMKDKYYYDASIVKDKKDWDAEIQAYIPDNFFHVPDPHYSNIILTAIENDEIIKAVGDPGAGKDTEIKWWCSILNWPYVRRDGAEGKEPSDELGYPVPDGKGGMKFADGILTKFVRHGGIYVHSEPDVNPASVNMALQSLKEPERILNLMGHPDANQAQIRSVPNFRYFETSNVRGTGDGVDRYSATTTQDQSSLNRVSYFCHKTYLAPEQEILMVKSQYPELTDRFIKKMVQLANTLRVAWREDSIELPYSPRNLLKWADRCVKYGEPVEGFKMTYYNALNEEEKGAVKRMWKDVDFDEYQL